MRFALFILILIFLVSLAAPVIAPFDPMRTTAGPALQSPDSEHLLGTDHLGRDVLSRLFYGGRRTLSMASLATLVAVTVGLPLGLSAGALGRRINQVVTVINNSMLAIPPLVIALVVLTLLGQGMVQLALATGIAQIPAFVQVTRSATITVRFANYVEGAQAIGATRLYIAVNHIFPNIKPTLLSYTGVTFAYTIINSAALSFLGLGGDPGVPDWGVIVAEGRLAFQTAPWVAIAPGLAIVITVMAVNTVADRLAAHSSSNL